MLSEMPHLRPLLLVCFLAGSAQADLPGDARTVLEYGPRVAGTAPNEQARQYLEEQFRALGYQTRREAFNYSSTKDLGSDVVVDGKTALGGQAMRESPGGEVRAPLQWVAGVGTAADFGRVNVRGKVAVVSRGQLPFHDKALEAQKAGALGLIVVNTEEKTFRGSLREGIQIPVLGVPLAVGQRLTTGASVTLNVRNQRQDVQAQNLVAYKGDLKFPDVLFGAHLDSVPGAPGANDNLSGALTVLEVARQSVNTPLSARSYFVLFDAEEDGLLGARDFVKQHPELTSKLRAMLNFDMVGVSAGPLRLTGAPELTTLVKLRSGVQTVNGVESGSDHVPFAQAGVPTLFFNRGIDANYHQPGDTILDPALLRQAAELGIELARSVLEQPPQR